MDDNETFDVFYAKLNEIVNKSFILGKIISNSKVVRNVSRFLLERFQVKVTASEECKDIGAILPEELTVYGVP
ncbi:hypothetical protein BVC80_8685g4 [Macleaya cordata]|uniref:Uncharacterized protein n=1 Tax=Macleaya cordata TaxID=56857 RepID=A0A200Q0T8_MACCD|nr:hypothetical protein BVC80_8685g4 [Macleaya cordata]